MADALLAQGAVLALTKETAQHAEATQGAAWALAAGAGAAQASMGVVLALVPSPAHQSLLTQGYAQAVTQSQLQARVTAAAVAAVVRQVPCVTRWAQCWRITRRDGVVLAFTSHDRPLEYQGTTYSPCYSLAASAAELGAVLGQPGNAELAGIIADEAITEADLYAGLYDRARVEVWMVPWQNAGGELPVRLLAGTTGNLSHGQDGFALEVLTPGAQLQQQPLLPSYTPGCRWELGDTRCALDLGPLTVAGSVTAALGTAAGMDARRVFVDAARAEPAGWFALGRVTWTAGPNAGQVSEVKSYAGGQFVLWRPAIHAIGIGDEYQAVPGCDRIPATCSGKFDNLIHYGGFPHVPGRDAIMQTPDTR